MTLFFGLAILFCPFPSNAVYAGSETIVPQLGITELDPLKVQFRPDSEDFLMVVNRSGRIDLFDVVNPRVPIKVAEIAAAAEDASFSPDGTRIVSGGSEGTIQLWTLEGRPAAPPFKAHQAPIYRVAFSADGKQVASIGKDCSLRRWTLEGIPLFEYVDDWYYGCPTDLAFSPVENRLVIGWGDGGVSLQGVGDGKHSWQPVLTVASSPDGRFFVSGGQSGLIQLWTEKSKPAGFPFSGHDGAVLDVAFSPDGSHIVSGGADGIVQLWTLDGNPAAKPSYGHLGEVRSVAFSPSGNRIASAGEDGAVRLWNLEVKPDDIMSSSGPNKSVVLDRMASDLQWKLPENVKEKMLKPGVKISFAGRRSPIRNLVFSPDGSRIISIDDFGNLSLWDAQGKEVSVQAGRIQSAAFSPDGSRFVTGDKEGRLQLWTNEGEAAAGPIEAHLGRVFGVAFSPDGSRIVSVGKDGALRLWDLEGKPVVAENQEGPRNKAGYSEPICSVAFSPGGSRIATGSCDGNIRLWSAEGELKSSSSVGHRYYVSDIAFSKDGSRIIFVANGREVRQWNLAGEQKTDRINELSKPVASVVITPDASWVVTGSDDGVLTFSTLQGEPPLKPVRALKGAISSIAFSPNGTNFAVGGNDGTIQLWKLELDALTDPYEGKENLVRWNVAFSQDGSKLFTSDTEHGNRFWSLEDEITEIPFVRRTGELIVRAWSPDGSRFAANSEDGGLKLWSTGGAPASESFAQDMGVITDVAFSPDGSKVVAGGADGAVRLWTEDGVAIASTITGHASSVSDVRFSPDGGRILVKSSDGSLRLWTLDGIPVFTSLEGNSKDTLSVAFSPDATRIVTGARGGQIRLWTTEGKPATNPLEGHTDSVIGITFSPSGSEVYSYAADGTVRFWNVEKKTSKIVYRCRGSGALGLIEDRALWLECVDRLVFFSTRGTWSGEVFIEREGLVALTAEGVYAPTDILQGQFRALDEEGAVLARRGSIEAINGARARQILLNDWTIGEQVIKAMKELYDRSASLYAALGWFKAAFWVAFVWSVAIVFAVATWLFAPHKLAGWAMPVVGSPPHPTWKWLASILTLYEYLGTTRRPLRAWVWIHRKHLYRKNFSERSPVLERKRFCDLGYADDIERFVAAVREAAVALVWINGVGGAGKSALAYQMLRVAFEKEKTAPLPILIDVDWDGSLVNHVASRMVTGGRAPTEMMVESLGAMGLVCPLVDSLSERGMNGAMESLDDAVGKGAFKLLVVTSRSDICRGGTWESFSKITVRPLTLDQVPRYIATYVEDIDDQSSVAEKIQPLVERAKYLSPLFVRFAIEQSKADTEVAESGIELVLRYVEALRNQRLNISREDMLRAATTAAFEAVRVSLAPREIDHEYLRAMLVQESDKFAFMDAKNESVITVAKVIDLLIQCGLLNQSSFNRRLQFAYDPVAEYLAAYRICVFSDERGVQGLRDRLRTVPSSALACTVREIEQSGFLITTPSN